MSRRVAIIGVIISDRTSVHEVNIVLHEYADGIIGRMGIPREGKNIISIAMDTEQDRISALSGKLGMLEGVNTKTIYGPE